MEYQLLRPWRTPFAGSHFTSPLGLISSMHTHRQAQACEQAVKSVVELHTTTKQPRKSTKPLYRLSATHIHRRFFSSTCSAPKSLHDPN